MNCDFRNCPHRMEGIYAKDSWQTYNACTLYSDMWDYLHCNPNASYCKFNQADDEEKAQLIKQKEEDERDKKLRKYMYYIDYNQREIMRLEEEIEEYYKKIQELNEEE